MTFDQLQARVRFYEAQRNELERIRGRGFDSRVAEATLLLVRAQVKLRAITDPRPSCLCGAARAGDRVSLGDPGELVAHELHHCRRRRLS